MLGKSIEGYNFYNKLQNIYIKYNHTDTQKCMNVLLENIISIVLIFISSNSKNVSKESNVSQLMKHVSFECSNVSHE